MSEQQKFGVIIGPLRLEQSPDETAKNIFRLLNCVGIRCVDTAKISVNPEVGYAVVEFYQKSVEDYAMKVLKEVQSIMNLYDLRRLTDKPQHLKAARLSGQAPGESQELSSISEAVLGQLDPSAAPNEYSPIEDVTMAKLIEITEPQTSSQSKGEHVFQLLSVSAEDSDTQISFQRLEEDEDDVRTLDCAQTAWACFSPTSGRQAATNDAQLIKVDAKTSTPQVTPCFNTGMNFYLLFQTLSTDIKNVYTDSGDILTRSPRNFRIMIGKYVCAFLNSGGGAIFFGVNQEGKIRGLLLDNRMEDYVRLDIDSQIKLINPLVPTSAYKVNIVNIMDDTGHLIPDLRLLEVEVLPLNPPEMKYMFKTSVFVWERNAIKEIDPADIFF
ncbi:schlafen-like protein 1 [Biomphalaria pfeifferi]|uniref:Schlafen-like protein 1 n=1 Tax=Biomphalaria pfeifferi TaxID=112525 RepID=A0AAD8BLQ1_BIOPF|nr:schlafen-like protein 1 [Biomphalaria pfeifferi]